ncbi:3-isopropylmalate dehydrogenase [Lysinibacillus irui]|uniref:3-isopropylmalate dehydrogenase n=1 Tax=Lysinibacillus irui TaxID=2998077 RepID=A0ABU5NST3_9BACI|nr:3-isopropylmalate dehydrogenase [Lysinibacillus irui]MEA0553216.1 3-isopropylmalate dehydrogenase [Lysinibacillus irui]MEA0979024.1 3-isopropylmalate dehydrogenase [Lysinibacillus irui]MEA1045178.1 3-isopropylmalate dehydrogenase [Lysinibacillus irui]
MDYFFIILMGFFIVIANIIGFISYRKKKNLYFSAFTILLLAIFFGALGGTLAIIIIRDPFALFYGMQLGYYLMINSGIVFIIAILATVVKKYNSKNI